jgi:hypothetical protein
MVLLGDAPLPEPSPIALAPHRAAIETLALLRRARSLIEPEEIMRTLSLLVALGMIVVLEGCNSSSPQAPDSTGLPGPDTTGSGEWTISEQYYRLACRQWVPNSPPDSARYAYDIWFVDTAADGGPTAQSVAEVQARGGEVLYRYHLRGLRVAIGAGQLTAMAALYSINWAETVADTGVRDARVIVLLSRPFTDADRVFLGSLGGRLIYVYSAALNGYAASIPDASVPDLKAGSGVIFVESDLYGCVA